MARTTTTDTNKVNPVGSNQPIIETKINTSESIPAITVNNEPQKKEGIRYALAIECHCGGKYVPLTYKVSDNSNMFYRCTKCGKDINLRKVPVNV